MSCVQSADMHMLDGHAYAASLEGHGLRGSEGDVRLQVDLNDIESSTILSFRYIVEMGDRLSGLEKRQALKDWLDLLSRSHPLNRYVIHPG